MLSVRKRAGGASADLAFQSVEQGLDGGEPGAFLGENDSERVSLQCGGEAGGERTRLRQRGEDDVDQAVGAVEAAPQIIVLAIGAAEEGAEAVELDALQCRRGPAG